MSKPLFSVVMPTRNRAQLLPFAINSVLNQTFADFEIIVSDNYSSDDTQEIVATFEDTRVKYFRSQKSLSIGDSWEFAIGHATGQYLTFLSDDDTYTTLFLETMKRVFDSESPDIVSCRMLPYFNVPSYSFGREIAPGSVLIKPYDRSLSLFDRREIVSAFFAHHRLTALPAAQQISVFPQLVNSAYNATLFRKAYSRLRTMFPILGSDIYSGAILLNLVEKYCVIDEPHYLHCQWEQSATSGTESVFAKYPEERELDHVPLKALFTPQNYCANAVLRAKSDWGSDYEPVPLDWKNYLVTSYLEMKYRQSEKIDVSVELDVFEQVLLKHDENFQRQVRSAIAAEMGLVKNLKSRLRRTILDKTLTKLKYRDIRILGGFADIGECAKAIDDAFLDRFATPK
jgi:glycosyltransferase involved in cell wall biosynthesis